MKPSFMRLYAMRVLSTTTVATLVSCDNDRLVSGNALPTVEASLTGTASPGISTLPSPNPSDSKSPPFLNPDRSPIPEPVRSEAQQPILLIAPTEHCLNTSLELKLRNYDYGPVQFYFAEGEQSHTPIVPNDALLLFEKDVRREEEISFKFTLEQNFGTSKSGRKWILEPGKSYFIYMVATKWPSIDGGYWAWQYPVHICP